MNKSQDFGEGYVLGARASALTYVDPDREFPRIDAPYYRLNNPRKTGVPLPSAARTAKLPL